MPGKKSGPLRRQARIIPHQALGKRRLVGINPETPFIADLIKPFSRTTRCVGIGRAGQATALHVHQTGNPFGAQPGVDAGDGAAHAVGYHEGRLIRRIVVQQCIQIGKIIRKPVGIVIPLRLAEAAPIGGDHPPFALQGIDDELE